MPTMTIGQIEKENSQRLQFSGDDWAEKLSRVLPKTAIDPPLPRPEESPAESPTDHTGKEREKVSPFVQLMPGRSPSRRFNVLQQLECVVTEVMDDSVWAYLSDLSDPHKPKEIAEFPLAEIPEADLHLLEPGSVFYWIIWREHSATGQLRRMSEIRVRRTPRWSQHDIEMVKSESEELFRRFQGDVENDPPPAR